MQSCCFDSNAATLSTITHAGSVGGTHDSIDDKDGDNCAENFTRATNKKNVAVLCGASEMHVFRPSHSRLTL